MRIGIDIRSIGKKRTGDESYTKNLVKNLLRIDQKNQYFFYTDTKNEKQIKNKIDPQRQYNNYKIISIIPGNKMLWTFYLLPRYLKKNPIDILHVQYITPQILPKKIKLVTTIHDVSFKKYPEFIKKSDLFFLNFLIPLSLKKADAIISVSQFTKKEIKKYYSEINPDKVFTVYNGVADNKSINHDDSIKMDKVRNKYNLPKSYLFYAGTLQPRKNIPFLIKSFEELKNKYSENYSIKNLKLVLTGDKKAHHIDRKIDQILKSIRNKKIKKDIIFLGYVADEDLPFVYSQSLIFCFCSLYEGFGLPLIEAMKSDVPVICSKSSCHQEIASNAACYFEENDLDDFTNKLFDIIINEEKRSSLIKEGKKRESFFSWKESAKKTLEIYNKVFNNF